MGGFEHCTELQSPESVTVYEPVDKTLIYRHLLRAVLRAPGGEIPPGGSPRDSASVGTARSGQVSRSSISAQTPFEIPLREAVEKEQTPAAKPIQVEDRTGSRATDCPLFILSQVRFASSTGYPARIAIR